MIKIKNKSISTLISLLIVMNCFSYPITAVVIASSRLPSSQTNIGLKVIYSLLALFIIYFISAKERIRFPNLLLSGLFFFFIYSVRLLYDIFIADVTILYYSPYYVLAYFFVATLLPIITVAVGYRYINIRQLTIFVFLALIISNVSLFYYLFYIGDFGGLEEQLSMRANIKIESVNDVGTLINPITIGLNGASLVLFCINLFLNKLINRRILHLLLYSLIALGFFILILGASRGPLLGLIVILIICLISSWYKSDKKIINIIKLLILIGLYISVLSGIISKILAKYDIFLLDRIMTFMTERSRGIKEARDYSFSGAWNDFLSSPFIGKQYVGTYDNFYPHNIFLEVLMATGTLGGIFFLLYFIKFIKNVYKLLIDKKYNYYIPLVGAMLLSFFLSLTSGSIFASPEIWIFMTLTILLPKV